MTIRARITPMPAAFLTRARAEGLDALGQQVRRVVAKGGEPCRDTLRRAQPGEELILASFSPFTQSGPYREYGPVFIAAQPSEASELRIGGDGDYLRRQFVIRAYSANEEILDAALVEAADTQNVVDRFFARQDVAFLHARFPTYGCFAVRFDRP